ncbi:MAG TPA: phosphate ABC transporter permease PtsA [Elusimicrobia bacterium]|nr:phosphate ABC transporter permease PtsA [Elusimicrobiota bacterium]HBT61932.1 phosphate ABC transporter permease PtsA [Elusimicrobiota bacterium]
MIGILFVGLTGLCCLVIVAFVAAILADIAYFGWGRLSLQFLMTAPQQGMTEGGIFPAIFGTFFLVLLMTLAVIPLGVMTAIYLHEYAPKKSAVVRWIRLAIENLAGVPAIVFGLFGLGFFIEFVGRGMDRVFFNGQLAFGQPAIIWAALTLALLTLPTVVVATEEALRAIPGSLREVAYSLGATRLQMVRRVVLPQAVGGILTGGILAVSRGAGEVAPILFTGAAYFLPYLPKKLNDQFMELGYHIYVMATQSPDVEKTKPILYSTVFVLLALTFALNFTAIWVRSRIRRKLRLAK